MVGADGDKRIPGLEDVQQEHAQIWMISRTLQESESPDVAASLLQEHRGMLVHHFATEEAEGGLYDTILEAGPQHERLLAQLRAQHAELLERVDTFLRDVGTEGDEATLLARVRAIADLLRKHESDEGALLLEVFNTDIGVGD